jgi:predicted nucleotidyltransferase component of viral defense system
VFDPDSVETEVIKEDAEYEGVRSKLVAKLEQARIRMQIDVGFGDAVQPEPRTSEFPTILKEIKAPILGMYPPEVVIAEKLHAMVVLDIRNSRMKDFYDLWHLARTGSFELATLRRSINTTFARRRTYRDSVRAHRRFSPGRDQDAAVARIPPAPSTGSGHAGPA